MQSPALFASAIRRQVLTNSAAVLLTLAGSAAAQAQHFEPLSSFLVGPGGARRESAEILAYTRFDDYTVLSTVAEAGVSFGVQILSLQADGTLNEKGFADFTNIFGAADTLTLSSVAVDPLGRGFGVASFVPANNNTTVGKVALFDYRGATTNSARTLAVLDVGYHPDSVKFSLDGLSIFVANEGEWNTANGAIDAPGSISRVDLSGISTISQVSALTNAQVRTYDFSSSNLASGVTLAGIRNPSIRAVGTSPDAPIAVVPDFQTLGGSCPGSDPEFYRGIEPEFITQVGNRLFVTLQENNAIGVFDLTTEKWEKIFNLGTITQTVDASDRDGVNGTKAVKIDQVVKTLPMPDAICSYEVDGVTYLVTANEGDFRTDDRDRTRFSDSSLDGMLDSKFLPGGTNEGLRALGQLGRAQISRIDGDTDGDGKIDQVVLSGSRSFSIWNAETGMLVWDSGSGNGDRGDTGVNSLTNLETVLHSLDPAFHNAESGSSGNFDSRSPQKGPEPEALTLAVIGGRTFALLGMERQNGLLMYDITNPQSPVQVGYTNAASRGLVSPESMIFIAAADNPTGKDIVLTGYELRGGGIGVDAVPEPGSTLLLTAGAGALLGLRRRRPAAPTSSQLT